MSVWRRSSPRLMLSSLTRFFRKDINVPFYKVFYSSVQRLRSFSDTFDDREFPFWDTIYTLMEYFFRIIVNEKGLQELEKTLKKNKESLISN